jgi:hypothetical protein
VALGDDVDVRGDLQDGVLRRVEDRPAGREVLGAEVVDRVDPVVGPVAEERALGDALEHRHDVRREAVGIGRGRLLGDDAHELPVARRRVLARSEGVQAAVDRGLVGRRHAVDRGQRAEPEATEHREVQPADGAGEVAERVGAASP